MIDILFPPYDFLIEHIELSDAVLVITAQSRMNSACCPDCATHSSRIHSRYQRTLADLPISGQRVRLCLSVHRFFCSRVSCSRKTFAEPLPDLAPRSARRTRRLFDMHAQLALVLGGEPAARFTCLLALPCSPATLLRTLARLPISPIATPRIIGIDDWAWRKGQRYGTIICDLQARRPIELLPDRTSASTAAWLKNHPSIEIISRDRGGIYAEAARLGAPQARQVADRWHVLHNLGEALELLVSRHLARRRKQLTQSIDHVPSPATHEVKPRSFSDQKHQEQRRQERLARYEQVVALSKQGMNTNRIAQIMRMGSTTVETWLAAGQFPERQPPPPRARPVPPWLPYALKRWQEGKRSILAIYRELQAQGYQGSYWSVYTYLSSVRTTEHDLPQVIPMDLPSAKQVRALFFQRRVDLTEEQERSLRLLWEQEPVLEDVYALVQRFTDMIWSRTHEPLQAWLEQVEASPFTELQTFVRGIRHDLDAVVAGLSLPWSQGQTEGQITRLKMIKRQMYGRAHFDLLRQRVLSAA